MRKLPVQNMKLTPQSPSSLQQGDDSQKLGGSFWSPSSTKQRKLLTSSGSGPAPIWGVGVGYVTNSCAIVSGCPGDTVLCTLEEEGRTVGDLCESHFRAQPHLVTTELMAQDCHKHYPALRSGAIISQQGCRLSSNHSCPSVPSLVRGK